MEINIYKHPAGSSACAGLPGKVQELSFRELSFSMGSLEEQFSKNMIFPSPWKYFL